MHPPRESQAIFALGHVMDQCGGAFERCGRLIEVARVRIFHYAEAVIAQVLCQRVAEIVLVINEYDRQLGLRVQTGAIRLERWCHAVCEEQT